MPICAFVIVFMIVCVRAFYALLTQLQCRRIALHSGSSVFETVTSEGYVGACRCHGYSGIVVCCVRISVGLSQFKLAFPRKCWDSTSCRPGPLPFSSFPQSQRWKYS
jgi:hypothetical protein